ncbi:class I SAM-dependent methyltransferase, partial [Streptomyces scabiei]
MVSRQVDEQIAGRFPVGQRLRVLDVGMGQGTQALRLARAGHAVTGIEREARLIAVAREALAAEPEGIRGRVRIVEGDGRDTGVHFLPGSFDVVLCHGVLMYVEEPDALLAGLARMLAPGGLLSLLVRNGDALAMRAGLAGDWAGALASFDTTAYRNRLGLDVRADRLATLTDALAGIGAPLHAWYGGAEETDLNVGRRQRIEKTKRRKKKREEKKEKNRKEEQERERGKRQGREGENEEKRTKQTNRARKE